MGKIIQVPGKGDPFRGDPKALANEFLRAENQELKVKLAQATIQLTQLSQVAYALTIATEAYKGLHGELADAELLAAEEKWQKEHGNAVHLD